MPRASKKRGNPEEIVQKEIIKFLREIRRITQKIQWVHPPNELLRTNELKKIYWHLGVESGPADLILFLDEARVVLIELKVGKRSASDKQKHWLESVSALGFPTYILKVNNAREAIDAIIEILRDYGIDTDHLKARESRKTWWEKRGEKLHRCITKGNDDG